MARVTVEDCVLQIPNRFELVLLAAHRARGLGAGAALKIERDRDKNPVVALREIAEQKLDLTGLEGSLIKTLQKRIEPDRPEEEEVAELMAGEQQSWINTMDGSDEDEASDEALDEESEAEAGAGDAAANSSFEDADIKD